MVWWGVLAEWASKMLHPIAAALGFRARVPHPAKSPPLARSFWSTPVEVTFAELKADPSGLGAAEAQRRLAKFGRARSCAPIARVCSIASGAV